MPTERGYTVYEGKSSLTGEPIMAVVTMQTQNRKTGNMPQLWIMRSDMAPTEAAKTGKDVAICGDCRFRPIFSKEFPDEEACYVTLIHGPQQIYRAFRDGRYPALPRNTIFDRPVRLGSYGDPGALPTAVVQRFVKKCDAGWTGYTHQWRRRPGLKPFCMASVNNEAEQALALTQGWRTFRVIQDNDYYPDPLTSLYWGFTSDGRRREIWCPAGEHTQTAPDGSPTKTWGLGERSQCDKCLLCDGAREGKKRDARRHIVVSAH